MVVKRKITIFFITNKHILLICYKSLRNFKPDIIRTFKLKNQYLQN